MTDHQNAELRYKIYEFCHYALNVKDPTNEEYHHPTFEETKELADKVYGWVSRY